MAARYSTTTKLKSELGISGAGEDGYLADILDEAESIIDEYTGRVFKAVSETRYFDAISSAEHSLSAKELVLWFDELLTITTLMNGDGVEITSAEYKLYPANSTPKYKIQILSTVAAVFTYSSGWEQAISIAGTWGFSSTAPGDIVRAATRLAAWIYRTRQIPALQQSADPRENSGLVVRSSALPASVLSILWQYVAPSVGASR